MAGAIIQALQADAITPSVAMKELRKLSDVIGLFSSITDEDIDEAGRGGQRFDAADFWRTE